MSMILIILALGLAINIGWVWYAIGTSKDPEAGMAPGGIILVIWIPYIIPVGAAIGWVISKLNGDV